MTLENKKLFINQLFGWPKVNFDLEWCAKQKKTTRLKWYYDTQLSFFKLCLLLITTLTYYVPKTWYIYEYTWWIYEYMNIYKYSEYIYIYIRSKKKLPKWLRNICITKKKCVFNFEKYCTLLLQRLWRKYIYIYLTKN